MTPTEWEKLCDGCGRCCLHKLQYEDTGEVCYTNVACRLLDLQTCRCKKYEQRQRFVPDCVALTADKVESLGWLPSSCAYRLLSEGRDLYWWHPLLTGDPNSVHDAGMSVRHRAIPERGAGDLENHLATWPE